MTTIELYPLQGQFVGTSAHYAAFVGGIGSGKSIAGCARALLASQGYIGTKPKLQTPNLGVITAPTYPMLRDATLRAFLDLAQDAVASFNKADMLARMVNGSEIIFRSTEYPDRLRGPSIAWWFGDEAALYTSTVFDIMIGRLRQFGQRGYSWIATTPKGRNWVYQRFVMNNAPGYKLFRARSEDNTFLDPAIVEAWRQSYVGDFAAQELGGEFVAFEGLIYPEFRRDTHMQTDITPTFAYHVAGVDWGYANPGVLLVFGVDSDGRMVLRHEEYIRQRRIEEWASVARQLHETYNLTTLYCDPSEPGFITELTNAGLNAIAATNDVLPGIQAVKSRLVVRGDNRPRLTITASAAHTAAEFEQYQWLEHREGIRDQPKKANDHAMDALRYAVMGVDGETSEAYGHVSINTYGGLEGAY